MTTIRITSAEDMFFKEFLEIYSVSFPVFEQRTEQQHIYAFSQPNYFVQCYIESDRLLGFIVYWKFNGYLYIEHLAIHPNERGKNYGTLFLSEFIKNNIEIIILEIDPIEDEISKKRYEFYAKLGFIKNSHNHSHPAYRAEFPDHKLTVLTTGRELTESEYRIFYSDLSKTVMNVDR